MAQSLINQLCNMMDGKHVMGCDALETYHHARAVKSAMLIHDRYKRFMAIKAALKNYHVIVNFTMDDKARVFDPQTKTEMIL